MPEEKEQKPPDPLEGAEALFGAKEGEFAELKKDDPMGGVPLLKFENDEDIAEEKENIQRALSKSVADRYEKMKCEGFTIEISGRYGDAFLTRMAALRGKQERDEISGDEAKELYAGEAELNNAMDAFEDAGKLAERSIPSVAKNVAKVYARFAVDETKGDVRLKKTEAFARDIEKYMESLRGKSRGELREFVAAIDYQATIIREVAEKERQLLDEGQLILGVQAKSLPELRRGYLAASKEMMSAKGGDDAWWERLQKIIRENKKLEDPIREHEEFQKLRKEVVVKYIQGEAKMREGIAGVMAGYRNDYVRGKFGKVTLETQRDDLQLLIRQKLMTRDQAQKIYNELEASVNETSARIITGKKEAPAPPNNIGVPRIAVHAKEILAVLQKKPEANKTLGGLLQRAIGWFKWGESR